MQWKLRNLPELHLSLWLRQIRVFASHSWETVLEQHELAKGLARLAPLTYCSLIGVRVTDRLRTSPVGLIEYHIFTAWLEIHLGTLFYDYISQPDTTRRQGSCSNKWSWLNLRCSKNLSIDRYQKRSRVLCRQKRRTLNKNVLISFKEKRARS